MTAAISLMAELSVPEDMAAALQVEAAGGTHKEYDGDESGLIGRLIDVPSVSPVRRQRAMAASLSFSPAIESEVCQDLFGNRYRRFLIPKGVIQFKYSALVSIDPGRPVVRRPYEQTPLELPPDAMTFLLPSRYCESDKLQNAANELFGNATPGYERVQAISDWITANFTYLYGVSDCSTSAMLSLEQRSGVCRDFAHVGISLCRALNIPARYVSGYCPDLEFPDLHAWFQAYVDGVWTNFDATPKRAGSALIEVAVGRDAADCAWCTLYGIGETVSMAVEASVVG